MDQASHRRALILEDEIVIAMDLEQAIYELGFETSELASTPSRAFSLVMKLQARHRFG
jgi:hypothetical protein